MGEVTSGNPLFSLAFGPDLIPIEPEPMICDSVLFLLQKMGRGISS